MNRPGVLVVDQGASFGGSVLVGSIITSRIPTDRYRVFLASAIEPRLLRAGPEVQNRMSMLTKPYNYVEQARARTRRSAWPTPLRRLAGWGETVLRIGRNAHYTRELLRWIRKENIRLVHLNNGFENLEAHLAAGLAGTPVVVHAHGSCGRDLLTRWLAGRLPYCIAISQPVMESFMALGIPRERIALVPNPLTVEPRFIPPEVRRRARVKFGIQPDMILAGSVGRIVEWKGQLEFLRAAAVALKSVPRSGAVVIGDVTDASEEYGRRLRREAELLGIGDRVWFTGFLADPEEAYSLVDVLVHTAIEPEPFGLVLTEAMAFGIPVIAANTGGPVEIVTEGVNGFLRDPRDSSAVAQVLTRLLAEPNLRAKIGAAGHDMVRNRFDPLAYAHQVADVYDRVLSGGTLETVHPQRP